MDQPKIERLLRVMMILTSNTNKTIEEIARDLEISSRSVYRYIDTFREAGFVIKKKGNRVRLDKASPYFREISELVHFTEEEAYILKSAIESIDQNNLIKQNLRKKLYSIYDYKILADTVVNFQNGLNIRNLSNAIEQKRKVILRKYASANSSEIRDRKVEAYAFTTNYVQLWCYEIGYDDHKLFNVSRIGSVEILDEVWEYEHNHVQHFIDVFRTHSHERHPVKLKMSLRAASLLTEEYPLAAQHLTKLSDNEWIFDADVCSFEGVGRFVLGLFDDIVILENNLFAEFIQKRLEKMHLSSIDKKSSYLCTP